MRFFIFKLNYKFSINNLAETRKNFTHKICFKKKFKFLNLKYTPASTFCNRFMQKGNFLKIYKLLKRFYYTFMLRKQFKWVPEDSNFFFFFKYNSFKDINRVLL